MIKSSRALCLLVLLCLLLAGCQRPTPTPNGSEPEQNTQDPTDTPSEMTFFQFEGNCFDNDFDKCGYIDPKDGEYFPLPTMKCTEDYYPHERGTLYFQTNEPCPSLVFLFYNNNKEYVGYHSFNNMSEGQYGATECGYFRCYVSQSFGGSIYFSTVLPGETPNYERKVTPIKTALPERTTIVNFGDSIFGNIQNATSISAKLTGMRGDVVYNCGFGGATMGKRGHTDWDAFAFDAIVDAICDNDYSPQEAAFASGTYFPNYFDDTVDLLQRLDWDQVDLITVAYGTNDYTENVDIATCTAALQRAVQRLREKLPHVKILIITPIWRYFEDGTDSDVKNYCGNGTLIDYKTAILTTAQALQIASLDAYEGLPMLKQDPLRYFQENDRTHTNELGREEYAKLINEKLNTILSPS